MVLHSEVESFGKKCNLLTIFKGVYLPHLTVVLMAFWGSTSLNFIKYSKDGQTKLLIISAMVKATRKSKYALELALNSSDLIICP